MFKIAVVIIFLLVLVIGYLFWKTPRGTKLVQLDDYASVTIPSYFSRGIHPLENVMTLPAKERLLKSRNGAFDSNRLTYFLIGNIISNGFNSSNSSPEKLAITFYDEQMNSDEDYLSYFNLLPGNSFYHPRLEEVKGQIAKNVKTFTQGEFNIYSSRFGFDESSSHIILSVQRNINLIIISNMTKKYRVFIHARDDWYDNEELKDLALEIANSISFKSDFLSEYYNWADNYLRNPNAASEMIDKNFSDLNSAFVKLGFPALVRGEYNISTSYKNYLFTSSGSRVLMRVIHGSTSQKVKPGSETFIITPELPNVSSIHYSNVDGSFGNDYLERYSTFLMNDWESGKTLFYSHCEIDLALLELGDQLNKCLRYAEADKERLTKKFILASLDDLLQTKLIHRFGIKGNNYYSGTKSVYMRDKYSYLEAEEIDFDVKDEKKDLHNVSINYQGLLERDNDRFKYFLITEKNFTGKGRFDENHFIRIPEKQTKFQLKTNRRLIDLELGPTSDLKDGEVRLKTISF